MVGEATVTLLTAEQTAIVTTQTNAQGKFTLQAPSPGRYLLVASSTTFGEARVPLTVGNHGPPSLEITLRVNALREDVTVTASPDLVEDVRRAGQPVNIIDSEDIATRVTTVVAQAVEGETGVSLQQTSPTMAGIFVRGLTGNKVNVFVDGVRYSNGAQRGGVNTFLDLIEPGAARHDRNPARAIERAVRQRRARRQRAVPHAPADARRRRRSAVGRIGRRERRHRAPVRRRPDVRLVQGPSLGLAGSLSGRGVGLVQDRRRHRLARGRDPIPRGDVRRADGRPAARHQLSPDRRLGPRAVGAIDARRAPRSATCARSRTAAIDTISCSAATAT